MKNLAWFFDAVLWGLIRTGKRKLAVYLDLSKQSYAVKHAKELWHAHQLHDRLRKGYGKIRSVLSWRAWHPSEVWITRMVGIRDGWCNVSSLSFIVCSLRYWMAKKDKNYVSIWFWMLACIVMGIPILNVIMICIWAFTGENESRKNYFKASIILFLIGLIFTIVLMSLGALPFIIAFLHQQIVHLGQSGSWGINNGVLSQWWITFELKGTRYTRPSFNSLAARKDKNVDC